MNQTTWGHILRTAVVGTARSPFDGGRQAGPDADHDPARSLLETLALTALARKAGHPLVIWSVRHSSFLPVADGERPQPSTFHLLPALLHGRYAALLDEWLSLVTQHGLQIPPEYLPELLDRAERDPAFWEKLRPAAGARGTWLAAQNPVWQSLYAPAVASADWFTADVDTRLRLLAAARRHRPLVALAWLEKTWPEESNEHRLAFLAVLRTELSLLDEDFLEQALAAKSREVRRAAAELLAALPESSRCTVWAAWAAELRGFVKAEDFAAFLTQKIPDVGVGVAAGLFALTDGKDLRSARQVVLQMLLRLLPPAVWGFGSPYDLLRDLLQNPERDFALPALLEATARHRDADWTADWLRLLNEWPDHALWRSAHLTRLLTDLDDPALLQLACFQRHLLADGQSAPSRALAGRSRPWPMPLFQSVLLAWLASARTGLAYPSPAFRAVLDQGALHCLPHEAQALCSQLLPDGAEPLPLPWQQGWAALVDVVRFRQEMWAAMVTKTEDGKT